MDSARPRKSKAEPFDGAVEDLSVLMLSTR
jgi:hypothetical protein